MILSAYDGTSDRAFGAVVVERHERIFNEAREPIPVGDGVDSGRYRAGRRSAGGLRLCGQTLGRGYRRATQGLGLRDGWPTADIKYAEVVFDQRTVTWLELHQRAFARLGGVPHVIVPDNLKAAVIRAAFGVTGLPELNRSYRELARHYGFAGEARGPGRAELRAWTAEDAVLAMPEF